MNLTVGYIEEQLRKFPKGTNVDLGCGCCHHSSSGHTKILSINDKTDQTYGYIEMNLNASSQPQVDLASNKEEFYKKEIERLNNTIKEKELMIDWLKDFAKSVQGNVDYFNNVVKRLEGE